MTGLEPSFGFSSRAWAYIPPRPGQAKNFAKPPESLVHSGSGLFALAPKDCGRNCG